jgi:hypothetical protein
MGELTRYRLNEWHLFVWRVQSHGCALFFHMILNNLMNQKTTTSGPSNLPRQDNTSVAAQAWQRFDTDPAYRESCANLARISNDRQA